jgi:sigma-B regulation protein RsbU (phosphoserine phosphatase)
VLGRRARAGGRRPLRARAAARQPAGADGGHRALPQPQRAGGDGGRDQGVPLSEGPAGGPPQLPKVPEDSAEDLYENAPCGYLSTLPGGLIVKVNQTFLDWTGFRRDELVGRRRFQDLLTAGGRIFHETHYAPLLHLQESVREVAVDLVRADGSRLPALVNSVLVKSEAPPGGEPPALVRTTVFDATDRREYERELLRARRAAEESEARARLLARTLQESLIPPALPAVPGLQVAAVYRPAGRGDEVGGDFYDVFEIGRGDWAMVIGDVCGKGAGAAVVTAVARYTIRAAAMRSRRPKAGLALVNAALRRQQPDRFCSMLCARVRRGPGGRTRLVVASGGHPLPLRVTADGTVSVLGRPGTLLGILDSPRLYGTTTDLAPGDVVVLYTDGVTEGRRGADFFGEERLSALLVEHRGSDATAIAERIGDEVVAFQDGLPRDDIALVVLKVPD